MIAPQADAEAFWEQMEAELAELSPSVTLEADAFYSQPEWDVYRMRYSGAGGHRLHAWFSVPKGDGPFPALVRMPDYASVHDIIYTSLRHRAVVMNATHRGQRNSDASVRSSYPGLLTEGIESAGSYHVLGAFADALRAIDALRAQEQVAVGAVALTGTGLGGSLALAAAVPAFRHRRRSGRHAHALGAPGGAATGPGLPFGRVGRLPAHVPRPASPGGGSFVSPPTA